MCGITGINLATKENFEQLDENYLDKLKKSISLISHRGPDDSGTFFDKENQLYLGHTRLSILDLSQKGHQPMLSPCKSYAIVFNGEIYNFESLKNELISKGHSFTSNSDTEVVLKLFMEMGEKMFQKLNGIFSMAIWDKASGILTLARDGVGVKPLYYFDDDKYFSFCSEIKGLIPFLKKNNVIDFGSLSNYLFFYWNPTRNLPLKGVKKVLPGEVLLVKNGKIIKRSSWYKLPKPNNRKKRIDNLEKKLTDKIREAVHSQMISDAPVGAFLSGGLDSSSVVAFAKEVNPKIECFTYDTGGNEKGLVDDLPYAIKVADYLKVPLEIIKVDSNKLCEDFESMIIQLDEPLADPAALNVKYISNSAKKMGIKVLLSGAGGDDIFTGYRRHKAIKLQNILKFVPKQALNILENFSSRVDNNYSFLRRFAKFFNGSSLSGNERIINFFKWNKVADLESLVSEDYKNYLKKEKIDYEFLDFLKKYPNNLSNLDRMLLLEQRYFLPDLNLLYTDKMSMCEGIETRVPLLDTSLIEFVSTIHHSEKQSFFEGKKIFKKVMEPFLPPEIIRRPKAGFGAPIRSWIKKDFQDLIAKYLNKESIKNRGLFNHNSIEKILKKNLSGEIDASYLIICLMSIEIWSRHFLDEINNSK